MHLITAQEITGLNPVEVTNKPQKGGNTSEFQKGARFFFEIKRRDSFCGFQSGALSGKALANPAIFSKRSFVRKGVSQTCNLFIAELYQDQDPPTGGA